MENTPNVTRENDWADTATELSDEESRFSFKLRGLSLFASFYIITITIIIIITVVFI